MPAGSNPYYDSAHQRELFALCWREPRAEAFELLERELRERRAELGAGIYYVGIVDPSAPMLDEATRAQMLELMEGTYSLMVATRVVILGTGLRTTMIRSAMVAMTLAAGLRGRPFFVDKSLWHTARDVELRFGYPAAETIDWLVSSGLVSREACGAPSS